MADLGSILRESRQTAHLSQETAAVQSFCDVSTIRRYENGSIVPSWDTICMLSDVYGDPGLKYRAQQEMEAWQDTFSSCGVCAASHIGVAFDFCNKGNER